MPAANTDAVVQLKGMPELLRALNKIPDDMEQGVRDASNAIASDLINGAQQAASTPLQRLAASGLTVSPGRIPTVRAGMGIVRGATREVDIFYGAEFGGRGRPSTMQFLEHRGKRGYFLYPTARARGSRYAKMWTDAIDRAWRQWDHRE